MVPQPDYLRQLDPTNNPLVNKLRIDSWQIGSNERAEMTPVALLGEQICQDQSNEICS